MLVHYHKEEDQIWNTLHAALAIVHAGFMAEEIRQAQQDVKLNSCTMHSILSNTSSTGLGNNYC